MTSNACTIIITDAYIATYIKSSTYACYPHLNFPLFHIWSQWFMYITVLRNASTVWPCYHGSYAQLHNYIYGHCIKWIGPAVYNTIQAELEDCCNGAQCRELLFYHYAKQILGKLSKQWFLKTSIYSNRTVSYDCANCTAECIIIILIQ